MIKDWRKNFNETYYILNHYDMFYAHMQIQILFYIR